MNRHDPHRELQKFIGSIFSASDGEADDDSDTVPEPTDRDGRIVASDLGTITRKLIDKIRNGESPDLSEADWGGVNAALRSVLIATAKQDAAREGIMRAAEKEVHTGMKI